MCRKVVLLVAAGIIFLAFLPIVTTAGNGFLSLFQSKGAEKETPTTLEALPPHEPNGGWPEHGITGTYDRAALQRGYQVYAQVCSACHSMKLMSYRDLSQLGFNAAEVKAIASNYQVPDEPDDQGEIKQRPARP